MARNYRKVEGAVERIREALGALSAACAPDQVTPYRGIGYAESTLMAALLDLEGPENTEDSPAFMYGYAAVQGSVQPELPFEA